MVGGALAHAPHVLHGNLQGLLDKSEILRCQNAVTDVVTGTIQQDGHAREVALALLQKNLGRKNLSESGQETGKQQLYKGKRHKSKLKGERQEKREPQKEIVESTPRCFSSLFVAVNTNMRVPTSSNEARLPREEGEIEKE